jgi:RNA polymerase sigma factor (sigma-70 family)
MTQQSTDPLPLHQRLARNEPSAWEELDSTYRPLLRGIHGKRFRGTFDDAAIEDVIQDTFLWAYQHIHRYDPERSPFGRWLIYRSGMIALDHLRALPDLVTIEDYEAALDRVTPTEIAADLDSPEASSWRLDEILQQFPLKTRQAISLYYYDNWTYEEIASLLEMNPGAVRVMVHRARKKIAQLFAARHGLTLERVRELMKQARSFRRFLSLLMLLLFLGAQLLGPLLLALKHVENTQAITQHTAPNAALQPEVADDVRPRALTNLRVAPYTSVMQSTQGATPSVTPTSRVAHNGSSLTSFGKALSDSARERASGLHGEAVSIVPSPEAENQALPSVLATATSEVQVVQPDGHRTAQPTEQPQKDAYQPKASPTLATPTIGKPERPQVPRDSETESATPTPTALPSATLTPTATTQPSAAITSTATQPTATATPSATGTPSSFEARWDYSCAPQVVDIVGTGEVEHPTLTLDIPGSSWSVLQLVGAGMPDDVPGQVRFAYTAPGSATQTLTAPTTSATTFYSFVSRGWSGIVTATLDADHEMKPANLIAYAPRVMEGRYRSVGFVTLRHVSATTGAATVDLALTPPLAYSVDVTVRALVMQGDSTSSALQLGAAAGGVVAEEVSAEQNGSLMVKTFVLRDVPAWTDQIQLRLDAPVQGEGALLGAAAWFSCASGGEVEGTPSASMPTPTRSATHTATPAASSATADTRTATATHTPVGQTSPTAGTVTPTSPSAVATATMTSTATATMTSTATATMTSTPATATPTPSPTARPVVTPVETSSATATATPTPVSDGSCLVYGIHHIGRNTSQLVTLDTAAAALAEIGAPYAGLNFQGMDRDPVTGKLWLVADRDGTPPGHVYTLDPATHTLTAIGASGFRDLTGISRRPTDGTLWAWARGDGLLRIDEATGAGTLVTRSDVQMDDLTWNSDGTWLYLTEQKTLWVYDSATGLLRKQATNLPGRTDAIDVQRDGLLVGTTHRSASADIYTYDPSTNTVRDVVTIPTQGDFDIDAIAVSAGCIIGQSAATIATETAVHEPTRAPPTITVTAVLTSTLATVPSQTAITAPEASEATETIAAPAPAKSPTPTVPATVQAPPPPTATASVVTEATAVVATPPPTPHGQSP